MAGDLNDGTQRNGAPTNRGIRGLRLRDEGRERVARQIEKKPPHGRKMRQPPAKMNSENARSLIGITRTRAQSDSPALANGRRKTDFYLRKKYRQHTRF